MFDYFGRPASELSERECTAYIAAKLAHEENRTLDNLRTYVSPELRKAELEKPLTFEEQKARYKIFVKE